MKPSRVITLTTDFGTRDWFVGTMKGVILSFNERQRKAGEGTDPVLVELTHEVASGDIRAGAFQLAASYRFFPKGSVHVAVVDPGVGSKREAIGVQTRSFWFVGPDNGVLSWALAREEIVSIHALRNQSLFLKPISRTFHGRDIFAPVAAQLSRGVRLSKFGPALQRFVRLDWPRISRVDEKVKGEVVHIDRIGNAITNIDRSALSHFHSDRLDVLVRGKRICEVKDFYQAVGSGKPVALLGSSDLLEVAVNGGNAARKFNLKIGTAVEIALRRSHLSAT